MMPASLELISETSRDSESVSHNGQPLISVFILTRNRLDVLEKSVRSVLMQEECEFEVVILDDASDGINTAAAVCERLQDARLRPYQAETSLGVAGGRNFLMSKCQGDIFVSLDDDAVFTHPDALRMVIDQFEQQPRSAILAFQITNVVRGERTPLVPFQRSVVRADPEIIHRQCLVSSFRGGGHALRREVFDQLGGYRSDMMFGEEEMDLAYRVINSGSEISYQPLIQVDHFPMPSVVSHSRRKLTELYYHVRNRWYLAWRYLPAQYLVSYLGIWMTFYAWIALKERNLSGFVQGIVSVPAYLRGVQRSSFTPAAMRYLRKNGGRLWM